MSKKIYVDAVHPEETRVVVVDAATNRVSDFDVETTTKPQIKGNIYLAKVIRVEPSLQAAFVDYGSGKNGFLPFQENFHFYSSHAGCNAALFLREG